MWKPRPWSEQMKLIRALVRSADLDAVARAWREGRITEWQARAVAQAISERAETSSAPPAPPET